MRVILGLYRGYISLGFRVLGLHEGGNAISIVIITMFVGDIGSHLVHIAVLLRLYGDNGKENGNYSNGLYIYIHIYGLQGTYRGYI